VSFSNKILTRDGTIELIEDKYMVFRVHDHITKPQKERFGEIIDAYDQLSKGKKHPLMLVAQSIDKVDDDEKKQIRETTKRFFNSQAIVTKNKFTVMVVNMLMAISPPPVPTKIFSDERKALKWLEQFMN